MVKDKETFNNRTINIRPENRTPHTALLLAFLEINGQKGYDSLKKYGYQFEEIKEIKKEFESDLQ